MTAYLWTLGVVGGVVSCCLFVSCGHRQDPDQKSVEAHARFNAACREQEAVTR